MRIEEEIKLDFKDVLIRPKRSTLASRREVDIKATWTGFEIPDEFVVGYGIDFAQRNRNLPYIGKVRFTD